jgi:hypothetical protein
MQLFPYFAVNTLRINLIHMKRLSLIAVLTIVFFASCEKYTIVQSKEYFPNTVGSLWIYKVTDHLHNKTYELEVRIVKDTLISNLYYKKWTYSCNDYTKSKYVIIADDSVRFNQIYNDQHLYLTDVLALPYEVGNSWENPYVGCYPFHYEVEEKKDLDLNNRNFTDVYVVRKSGGCPNDYITERLYVKPNVGLVKFEASEILWTEIQNDVWELERCDLK